MRAATRLPRFWLGLVSSAVGAWWVGHDETMKYVLGLLLLTAGLVTLATVVLASIPILNRVLLVVALGAAVAAAGIVIPVLRADSQVSSLWVADVSGQSWFATDDAVLVAGHRTDDGDEDAASMLSLDSATGKVAGVGTLRDGTESRMFTANGDLVQVSRTGGTVTVDYVTRAAGQAWTREFPEKRQTEVRVIAGADGRAAVRTCRPGQFDLLTSCVVSGLDPSGDVAWSQRLDALPGLEWPEDRLVPEVLGSDPDDTTRLRVLNLQDGSIVGAASDRDSDDAEEYLPRDYQSGSTTSGGTTLHLENLQIDANGDTILGRSGEDEWRREIPGARWISSANGGIAIESEPTGWSPFLPWRTSGATAITMLDPQTGAVTSSSVVPFRPRVYPVSDRAAIVTGTRDGSDGEDEQRLVGRR